MNKLAAEQPAASSLHGPEVSLDDAGLTVTTSEDAKDEDGHAIASIQHHSRHTGSHLARSVVGSSWLGRAQQSGSIIKQPGQARHRLGLDLRYPYLA